VDENQAGERRLARDDTSQSLRAKLLGNHQGYFAEPGGVCWTCASGQNSYM
jgi:hypothetical protein